MVYFSYCEIRFLLSQWIQIVNKLHLMSVVLQESVVALAGHLPYGEDPVKEETEGIYILVFLK